MAGRGPRGAFRTSPREPYIASGRDCSDRRVASLLQVFAPNGISEVKAYLEAGLREIAASKYKIRKEDVVLRI